jgi:hypothetical protein
VDIDKVLPIQGEDWHEFDHHFKWDERGFWETTTGRKALILPPRRYGNGSDGMWIVDVPSTDNRHHLTGENVHMRAFCIAEIISRQTD